MRAALTSHTHTRRVLTLCLVGVFATIAAAQQPITMPPAGAAAQPSAADTKTAAPAPANGAPAAAAQATDKPAVPPLPVLPPKAPIIHSLSFPNPASHVIMVKSAIPTEGRNSVELMMSVWTPGFYRVENYAAKVLDFAANRTTGEPLTFEKTAENRWRVSTEGDPVIVVSYRLECVPGARGRGGDARGGRGGDARGRGGAPREYAGSVSQSVVNQEYAVICGGPTYLTLVGELDRPHEVRLQMPTDSGKSASGLAPAPDSYAHHYWAKDFDTLMDSPIAAGNLDINSFVVNGSRHHLVDIGNAADMVNWDGSTKIADLQRMVQETHNFWGFLPFDDYYFLNKVVSGGGGGLEHLNSTLIHTAPPRRPGEQRAATLRWLNFVAHEYFHTFNVKRLRPVELGPFDYEHARRTSGLWVAEGLTNYFNSLIVGRAALCTPQEYLDTLSGHIRTIQNSPGRLAQSLAASSLETWTGDGFGGNRGQNSSISYYEKGPIVGFLLDAKKSGGATGDKKSLDDVMRLAYSRYSLAKGYTEQEFLDTAQEVAGIPLKEFFDKDLFSTEEVDYTDALDWFGVRFAPSDSDRPTWRLEVNPDATDEQKAHFASYLAPSKVPAAVAEATAPAPAETQPKPAQEPVVASTKPGPLVEGIGGVFIFSNDPARLAEWYQKCLGIEATKYDQDGAFVFAFKYRKSDNPNVETETVWAILPSKEDRAGAPQYQLNYRVSDIDQMVNRLNGAGVEIEKRENYNYGRFAWVRDPDGNRVELFQKATLP